MPTHSTHYRIKVKSLNGVALSYTPQYKYRFIPLWFSWKRFNEGGGTDPLSYRTLEEANKKISAHLKAVDDNKKITTSYIPFIQ